MEQTAKSIRAAVNAYAAEIGLTYTATFVPQRESRNANDKRPSLNWRIVLTRNGRTLVTDYTQGIGNVPGYKHNIPAYDRNKYDEAAQTGKYPPNQHSVWMRKPLPIPTLANVLYSLVLDADVLEHSGFEDWAANFGYETDSRKAEATYRACVEIALQLRAILGDVNVAKFREMTEEL